MRWDYFIGVVGLASLAACGSEVTGGGGGSDSGGSGGASTGTGTQTYTATGTGQCASSNTLPDPCCQPFTLAPSDCPAQMPADGTPCDPPNGVCEYPENCGEFPDPTQIRVVCSYRDQTWFRYEPSEPICPDGFSEIPVACPCTPPTPGEPCGFNVVNQVSPCAYAACETYECGNLIDSVWELIACPPPP